MRLKSINIENFRVYYGKNSVTFNKDERSITIINGANGFGKTTFLTAIVWCLYGQEAKKIEGDFLGKVSYKTFLRESLNHCAKNKGKQSFKVNLVFENINGEFIEISRSSLNCKDVLKVYVDGEIQDKCEDFIRHHILPLSLARFYLFDSEKIVQIADGFKNQNTDLREAFQKILGLSKYNHLKVILYALKKEAIDKSQTNLAQKKELSQKEAKLQAKEIELNLIIEQKRKIEKEAEELKHSQERKRDKYNQLQKGFSQEELDALKSKIAQLKQEKKEQAQALQQSIQSNAFIFALNTEIFESVYEDVKKDIDYQKIIEKRKNAQEDIKKLISLIEQKVNQSLQNKNMIVTNVIKKQYAAAIKDTITEYMKPKNNLAPQKIVYGFESLENFEVYKNEAHELKNNFSTSIYEEKCRKIAKEESELNDSKKSREDNQINVLKKELKILDTQITEKNAASGKLENEASNLKVKCHRLKNEIERQSKAIVVQDNGFKKFLDDSLGYLKQFQEDYTSCTIGAIERLVLENCNAYFHKHNIFTTVKISIMDKKLQIELHDEMGEKDITSLSMGERELVSLSFLQALKQESGFIFPVFIDSPFQKLDKMHRQSLLKQVIPTLANQVIFFPLDTELTNANFDTIKAKVQNIYILNQSFKNTTTIASIAPEIFQGKLK